MRICYLANSRFPSERAHMTQIVAMCNAFAEQGNEVTLVVTNRKTEIKDMPEVFFGVPINFMVVRISVPDIAGASPKIPPVLRPFLFTIQRLIFAYRASRCINSFELVYGRDEWVLWLMSLFSKVHIVWESHEARYSIAGKMLIKKGVPIVAISEGIRDFYIQQGVTQKILVAHDAVDDRFFVPHISTESARKIVNISTEKPIVMYIGGLEKWKGAETLLQASCGQSEFETYIIGGKEKEITALKRKYPHVHFLGQRPYRELPHIQQAADILVIPNTAKDPVSERYTSPLKLFAYMTSKKPIVASRISSITNVVSDKEVFLCNPDDANSLRDAITEAVAHPESAQIKAEAAYKKSFMYTWNVRAKEIVKFLEDGCN